MDFAVIRKIDKLGRIVIPKDFRKALGVDVDSELTIRLKDGVITVNANLKRSADDEN
ncbi:MAG: AbrB/MazE/SpoVT family DNA-binding domain-containing protein [Oscillospiraceae bacterium]|nr:AbrB/MazE/SpoVT family DNA-binding domain-containing protein [Oscillospiraceae bacterium]